jgi:hypothetical protein
MHFQHNSFKDEWLLYSEMIAVKLFKLKTCTQDKFPTTRNMQGLLKIKDGYATFSRPHTVFKLPKLLHS